MVPDDLTYLLAGIGVEERDQRRFFEALALSVLARKPGMSGVVVEDGRGGSISADMEQVDFKVRGRPPSHMTWSDIAEAFELQA